MTDQPLINATLDTPGATEARAFRRVLEDARRRRSRRTVVLVLGIFVAGLGTEMFRRMTRQRDALRAASASWIGYARCLVGSALDPGESLMTRLLRMELSLPQAAGATDRQDWPGRCGTLAEQLRISIQGPHLDRLDPNLRRLGELARHTSETVIWSAEPTLPDEIWQAARAAGFPPVQSTIDPLAPRPAHPLAHGALAALPVPFPSRSERQDMPPGDQLRLRFNGPNAQATTLCIFSAGPGGEPLGAVRCDDASSVVPPDRPALAGFVRTAHDRFDRFELVQPRVDAEPQVTALRPGIKAVGLWDDQLVWVEGGPDGTDLMVARSVAGADASGGPEVALGEVVGRSHELSACRTAEALVVRVRSYDTGLAAHRSFAQMAFHARGEWKRAPKEVVTDNAASMSCRGTEGTLTWLDEDEIAEARCTPDGCETSSSGPLEHPWAHLRPLEVADLDGKVLLVGIADGSGPFSPALIHSVRMRLATIDVIAKAGDAVLWGDALHEGVDPVEIRLFIGQGAAVAVVNTADDANRAIRIDPSGRFDPVRIGRN